MENKFEFVLRRGGLLIDDINKLIGEAFDVGKAEGYEDGVVDLKNNIELRDNLILSKNKYIDQLQDECRELGEKLDFSDKENRHLKHVVDILSNQKNNIIKEFEEMREKLHKVTEERDNAINQLKPLSVQINDYMMNKIEEYEKQYNDLILKDKMNDIRKYLEVCLKYLIFRNEHVCYEKVLGEKIVEILRLDKYDIECNEDLDCIMEDWDD